jgi:Domain of unknown function (DUF1918)
VRRFEVRPKVGDRIVVESERVAQTSRVGVIEEVIRENPPRVRVRWDDGHESVFAPSDGAAVFGNGGAAK